MPTVDIRNRAGDVVGQMELSEAVFEVPLSRRLVHQVLVGQQANRRTGNANTKTRGEVRGGGAKPYRQKGTGRARQGSIRAPQYRGGGTVFGPRSRDWRKRLPQAMRRLALRQILSDKVRREELVVLDEYSPTTPKTREVAGLLKTLGLERRVLLLVEGEEPTLVMAARNIQQLQVERVCRLCALDAARAHVIVATRGAVERLQEMYTP